MNRYRLHCFAQSGNAYKPALALALAGLDWEAVFVDFFNGATRTPEFRALNAMGEVPVLEHRGQTITQSGAILDYIAARENAFFDPGPENAREALRWMLFDCQKLSGYLGPWRFFSRLAPEDKRVPEVIAFLEMRARAALAVLDAHLEHRDWIAAPWLTTADLACSGYLFYPDEYPIDWASEYPHIARWCTRMRAVEGFALPYDLMPGHPQ
ncbi:MAG: glutathione S-transferase [Pseudomonadota bacterium]